MSGTTTAPEPTLQSPQDLSPRAVAIFALAMAVAIGLALVWAVSVNNTITPTGIVIHHSALIPQGSARGLPPTLDSLDEFHHNRGLGAFYWGRVYHVGYHYVIFPDGTTKRGRPEHCLGAHAKHFNSSIGIVLIGDFSTRDNPGGLKGLARPTAEQMRSLVTLCRRLQDRYKFPLSRIVRHSDVSATECPGDRFPYGDFLKQME